MQHDGVRQISARPLSAEAFAPYGDVVEAPAQAGRAYFATSLGNLRPSAHPKLWMLTKLPAQPLPLEFRALERHEFSSQTFVPIDIGRWLVVVAPHDPQGGPAADRVEAFLARPTQGGQLSTECMAWELDGLRSGRPLERPHVAGRHAFR